MFRSQLVFEKQRDVFDYWHDKCTHDQLPSRSDISPTGFVKALPMISLIEISDQDGVGRYSYRLAGTGLHAHFQQEVTGKSLSDLYDQQAQTYWQQILDVLVARKAPACGTLYPDNAASDHLVQFWMRLPLVDTAGMVNMVLSYDLFMPLSALSPENQDRVATA